MGLLWLVMAVAVAFAYIDGYRAAPLAPAQSTIDPNTARWWELTVLPQVGPATSHAILRYRQSFAQDAADKADARAFRCVADLDGVPGIGPVTLQQIGKYLDF